MPEAPWVNRCPHGTVIFTDEPESVLQTLEQYSEEEKPEP